MIVIKIMASVELQNLMETRDFQRACDFSLSRCNQHAQHAKNFLEFLKNMYCVIREIRSQASAAKLTDYRRHLHIREQNFAKSRSRIRTPMAYALYKSSGYTQSINGRLHKNTQQKIATNIEYHGN